LFFSLGRKTVIETAVHLATKIPRLKCHIRYKNSYRREKGYVEAKQLLEKEPLYTTDGTTYFQVCDQDNDESSEIFLSIPGAVYFNGCPRPPDISIEKTPKPIVHSPTPSPPTRQQIQQFVEKRKTERVLESTDFKRIKSE
jgi:hypothetical protein